MPLSSSRTAPITVVSPEMATSTPKWSTGAPSEGRSLACWTQSDPSKWKMYAEPQSLALSSSHIAPTTAVSPSMATA